ncbi:hypothetical protein LCGC14_1049730 [marine sediment metagenome]|uniref:Recombination endonuclease VII n=1 Tax=marine sediment metagenome TaxID=412755 RepID=A0A0F9MTM4_9ZZZZ
MWCKVCTKCKKDKPLEDFKNDKNRPSGYGSWCKRCHTKDSINWRQRNTEARWRDQIKQKYGIDYKEYERIFEKQKSLCAICRKPEMIKFHGAPRKLAVDHNHDTGKVRGLLCTKCNLRLGYLEDLEFVIKARIYLSEYDSV